MKVFTTGQVAKICKVAPRTVSKWFDSGQLRGYRIPGSKDRRIPLNSLIRFMKTHNIPLDGLQSGRTRILIIDDESEIVEVLEKVLTEQANYEVRTVHSGLTPPKSHDYEKFWKFVTEFQNLESGFL